jgi:hypothetical protein
MTRTNLPPIGKRVRLYNDSGPAGVITSATPFGKRQWIVILDSTNSQHIVYSKDIFLIEE